MSITLFIFFVINFIISWVNAWSCGRGWAESKRAGGLYHFMNWMGAIMSACGFTWCYLVILTLAGQAIPPSVVYHGHSLHLPDRYATAIFGIGYLMIIVPVIGSGIAITIQSWAYFWKERNFRSGAVAGWNTFADIYNIYEACHAVPEIFGFLKDLWGSEDESPDVKTFIFGLLIAAAVVCVVGGILTTAAIIRTTARNVARAEMPRWRAFAKAKSPQTYGA